MRKLLFQSGTGCLGTLLLITQFSSATPATSVQLTQAVTLAQSQAGGTQLPRGCNIQSNQPADNTVSELVVKAREYTNSRNPEKAVETLTQAFQLLSTAKNAEAKANWVRDIIITPDGDTSLLEKLVTLSVETGQKEQLSPVLSQALPVAQSLSTSYSFVKTSALTAIAHNYATIGQSAKAVAILPQSLQTANSIRGADFKTIALTAIAKAYLAAGQREQVATILSQALSQAKAIQSPNAYRKGEALGQIAITYAKAGEYNQAIQVAQIIENTPYYKASVLGAIATQYAQAGQMEQAIQIAQTLEMPDSKAKTLTTIAAKYAADGQQAKASEVFSQAIQIAQTAGDGLLGTIAIQYAQAGQPDAALSIVSKIDDAHSKAIALTAIALEYTKAGQPTKASPLISQTLETIQAIPEAYQQSGLRQEMIRNFVKAGQYDFALQVVQVIDDNFAKSETLREIAKQAAEAGEFDKALQIVQGIDKSFIDERNAAFQKIALSYASAGQYDKAIQVTQAIENYGSSYTYRARTLGAIANQLGKAGQAQRATEVFSQAVQVANSLEFPSNRAEALGAVALEYALGGQQNKASETLSQALQLAQTIEDVSSNSYTLRTIADQYIFAQRYDLAFRVAQAMKEPSERSFKLQEISDKFIEGGQYDTALQVANILETPSEKAKLLIAIAGKYIQTGQKNKAIEILAQAFQVARTIEGPESKVIVVKTDYDGEGNIIGQTKVDDAYDRASSLEEIALKYAQAGQYNQAVQVAQVIENVSTRNQLNQRLACYR